MTQAFPKQGLRLSKQQQQQKKHILLKVLDVKHVNPRVLTPSDVSKHIRRVETNHKARGWGQRLDGERQRGGKWIDEIKCPQRWRDLRGSSASSCWLERRGKKHNHNETLSGSVFQTFSGGFLPHSVFRPLPSVLTVQHQHWVQRVRIFPSYPLPPLPLLTARGGGGGGDPCSAKKNTSQQAWVCLLHQLYIKLQDNRNK